jgi:hypothetical protein
LIFIFLAIGTYIYIKVSIFLYKKLQPANKKLRIFVIVVLLLLPFIDVFVGYLFFIPLCKFNSGMSVYDYIYDNNSILIEDGTRYGLTELNKDRYFIDGIEKIEMEVKELAIKSIAKEAGMNEYTMLSDGRIFSKKIENVNSEIYYKGYSKKLFLIPVYLYRATLINNRTNKVLSVNNSYSIKYIGIGKIPYFNWLSWHKEIKEGFDCNYSLYKFMDIYGATIHK